MKGVAVGVSVKGVSVGVSVLWLVQSCDLIDSVCYRNYSVNFLVISRIIFS